jgi:uncharacterized protein (DUF1330 family)
MSAYRIGEIEITNPAGFEPYRVAAPATFAQYGGRLLTRGGTTELLEGGPKPEGIAILEFADATAVKRWYHSPVRFANSTGRLFIVEGVS